MTWPFIQKELGRDQTPLTHRSAKRKELTALCHISFGLPSKCWARGKRYHGSFPIPCL